MTPFMSLLLPVLVAAVAVFVVSLIVMAMPWHKRDYGNVPSDAAAIEAIRALNLAPGDYSVPNPRLPGGEDHTIFHLAGIITFCSYTLGAWPLSIWYHRKWSTALKTAFDALLYGAATGLIFTWMWPKP